MEPGKLCLLLTFIIYALFCDSRILYIFLAIGLALTLFHLLTPNLYNSTRRKLMIATWAEPQEGIIHSKYEANLTHVHEYIHDVKEKLGLKITVTHVVLRIIADVLKELPDVNGRIVFGKYFPYDRVNVSCLVDIDQGTDLAVALIEDADKKTIEDIAEYLVVRANKIKAHKDEDHKNQTSTFKPLPSFLIAVMLQIAEFVGVDFGIGIKALSLKKFQFGGAMVTNVGPMGIKDAFGPFTPFARVPILVTLCETTKKPIVEDDKIVIAPISQVNFTIDHRFMDGGRVKKVMGKLDEYFNNPYVFSRLKKDN